jgi:hypothetical protein
MGEPHYPEFDPPIALEQTIDSRDGERREIYDVVEISYGDTCDLCELLGVDSSSSDELFEVDCSETGGVAGVEELLTAGVTNNMIASRMRKTKPDVTTEHKEEPK